MIDASPVRSDHGIGPVHRHKIAVDVRTVLRERTGIGHYAEGLVQALVRTCPEYQYLLFTPKAGLAIEVNTGLVEQRRTHATPFNRYTRDFWENAVLPLHLLRWHAEVFHSTSWLLPVRRLPMATVVTVHDLTHFKMPELHRSAYGRVFRLRARRSLALADAVMADSTATKNDLIEVFGVDDERVSVIHLGVDDRFNPAHDQRARDRLANQGINGPFLLSVGTIEPRKNHTRLIQAFERLADHLPQLHLVLAGRRGWLDKEVFAYIESSPVRSRIRHLAYVPDDDLPELYRLASVVAYPSLYEGFGLPPLEAMACGTPVLTSNCSSLPEVVGDAAELIDPTSVDEIADGLNRLLTNRGLRAQRRQAGINRARRFRWETTATQTMAVYRVALERYSHIAHRH